MMLIIGELINGMYKNVAKAIEEKDEKAIQRLAADQTNKGASMLDVNTGPYAKDPVSAMEWLVNTIQEVTNAGLVLDSTKSEVIERGLKTAKNRAMINSANADDEKLKSILPLVKKYNTMLIALTMDKKGVPRDKNERLEHAANILASCEEFGVQSKDLFIDPIVLPVNVAQAQAIEVLEALKELRLLCDPPVNTIIGLSNISQRTKARSLINTTFLIMAMANGLSSAIVDPLDNNLMNGIITAELLLNKNIYCDSYLESGGRR